MCRPASSMACSSFARWSRSRRTWDGEWDRKHTQPAGYGGCTDRCFRTALLRTRSGPCPPPGHLEVVAVLHRCVAQGIGLRDLRAGHVPRSSFSPLGHEDRGSTPRCPRLQSCSTKSARAACPSAGRHAPQGRFTSSRGELGDAVQGGVVQMHAGNVGMWKCG